MRSPFEIHSANREDQSDFGDLNRYGSPDSEGEVRGQQSQELVFYSAFLMNGGCSIFWCKVVVMLGEIQNNS